MKGFKKDDLVLWKKEKRARVIQVHQNYTVVQFATDVEGLYTNVDAADLDHTK